VESFDGRLRDECLNENRFDDLTKPPHSVEERSNSDLINYEHGARALISPHAAKQMAKDKVARARLKSALEDDMVIGDAQQTLVRIHL
jgi:hypothetical protein